MNEEEEREELDLMHQEYADRAYLEQAAVPQRHMTPEEGFNHFLQQVFHGR